MSLLANLKRLVAGAPPAKTDRLYAAIVAQARRPDWYMAGAVPDSIDGRFDMLALILSLVMLRLEALTDGDARHPGAQLSADLADRFIIDMDGNLRQDGVGDQGVPRHLGQMMAALGGRIGAYRTGLGDPAALASALTRNLYRGAATPEQALAWAATETRRLATALAALDFDQLAAGRLETDA